MMFLCLESVKAFLLTLKSLDLRAQAFSQLLIFKVSFGIINCKTDNNCFFFLLPKINEVIFPAPHPKKNLLVFGLQPPIVKPPPWSSFYLQISPKL